MGTNHTHTDGELRYFIVFRQLKIANPARYKVLHGCYQQRLKCQIFKPCSYNACSWINHNTHYLYSRQAWPRMAVSLFLMQGKYQCTPYGVCVYQVAIKKMAKGNKDTSSDNNQHYRKQSVSPCLVSNNKTRKVWDIGRLHSDQQALCLWVNIFLPSLACIIELRKPNSNKGYYINY